MPYQSVSSLLVVIAAFNAAAGLLWGVDYLHKGVSKHIMVLLLILIWVFMPSLKK